MSVTISALQSDAVQQLYHKITICLEEHNADELYKALLASDPAILPLAIKMLDGNTRNNIWVLLHDASPTYAASLLGQFSEAELISLMGNLPIKVTVSLFQHIRASERRTLIQNLPDNIQTKLKRVFPSEWLQEERAALSYAKDQAGGISKNEILKLNEEATVADLSDFLRKSEKVSERLEWRYVYLCDELGLYLGSINIREVFQLKRGEKLKDYLDDTVPVITAETDLNTLKPILDTTVHQVIPVVNELGFQLGVVGLKHLNEALYEQSKQQLLEQSGVLGGDEFRHMPILIRNIRRLAFLLPSVVLSYFAVSIIAAYEPTIEKIAILAAILPLVANLSGAAGNQAVAVSIRELSTGYVTAKDWLYVVVKELPIGLINGIAVGIIIGLLGLFIDGFDNPSLPLLIGGAYTFSSVFAVVIGGSLPLFITRFKLDPAMLSSPILTTLTDAFSFFSVLFLAQAFLL